MRLTTGYQQQKQRLRANRRQIPLHQHKYLPSQDLNVTVPGRLGYRPKVEFS
jgi:hypothetical protein